MADDRASHTAEAVFDSVQQFQRRLRQYRVNGEVSPAEGLALSRLDALGPITAADLARAEGISPQSMGATLSVLKAGGLIKRRRDEEDQRRILLEVTEAGRGVLDRKRDARAQQLAVALADGFTEKELDLLDAAAPLLERLAAALR